MVVVVVMVAEPSRRVCVLGHMNTLLLPLVGLDSLP